MSCPVCFDDTTTGSFRQLECGHSSCDSCLRQWFATEETTGQPSPTCPVETCRRAVGPEVALSVLGRAFVAAGSGKKRPRVEDASTQQWLDQNTLECGGCQTPLIKSSGCDKVQCLCGYRICWRCKTPGAACSCNLGHGFVDNVTGQPAFGPAQPASPEELQDFKGFLQKKKQRNARSSIPDYFLLNHRKRPRFYSPMLHFPDPLDFPHNIYHPPTQIASAPRDFTPTLPGLQSPHHPWTNPVLPHSTARDDEPFLRAVQLSLESMTEFEKDLEQAIRLSLNRSEKRRRNYSLSNASASHPVVNDRKLAPQSGKSATDPVCLDDDSDDE